MDKETVLKIIQLLTEDLESPAFTEENVSDESKHYNEGYKNALIEFKEQLEDLVEFDAQIQ